MNTAVTFGLGTFGDNSVDLRGDPISSAETIRNIVEQGVLADRVGVNSFTIVEHHRDEFAVSAPDTVLAGLATRTDQITLGTAVTVLSSDDPIRVYQRFATIDALSNGRAEVTLGRGSFTESFPLFGFDLADYEKLFDEKLELFALVRKEAPVTWSGTARTPLRNQSVYPRTAGGSLPTWIGVGGSPESVARAAHYGFLLMLAIIGGAPARFAPYVDLHRTLTEKLGFGVRPVGSHSGGFVAATDEEARDTMWKYYAPAIERVGRDRGWPPPSRAQFEQEVDSGSIYAGSPETVARRIADTIRTLKLNRFDLKYASGAMPHELLMSTIELYGSEVVPRVRRLLSTEPALA